MNFNYFIFPAPKKQWEIEDYEDKIVWIPVKKPNVSNPKFAELLNMKKDRVPFIFDL